MHLESLPRPAETINAKSGGIKRRKKARRPFESDATNFAVRSNLEEAPGRRAERRSEAPEEAAEAGLNAAGGGAERSAEAKSGGERPSRGRGGRRGRLCAFRRAESPSAGGAWEARRRSAMASMAAAIAASRTAVLNGNRPLDERERKRFSYFSSLNPMARKIMAEKERIRERYGPDWERLPPRQQDEIIDKSLVQPHVQARYAAHRGAARDSPPPVCYPNLRLNTGQKVVHFGDEVSSRAPVGGSLPMHSG